MGLLFLILLMPECQFLRSLEHSPHIYNLSISFQFLSIYLPNLDETFFYRLGSSGLGLALGQGCQVQGLGVWLCSYVGLGRVGVRGRGRGSGVFLYVVGKGWGEREGLR